MKQFHQLKDQDLLYLWFTPPESYTLGQVYTYIADWLNSHGYEGVTVNKVRRRIKSILHARRRIPRCPTQEDYKRARRLPKGDELN